MIIGVDDMVDDIGVSVHVLVSNLATLETISSSGL